MGFLLFKYLCAFHFFISITNMLATFMTWLFSFQKDIYLVSKIFLYFLRTTDNCYSHPETQFTGWQLTNKALGHIVCHV